MVNLLRSYFFNQKVLHPGQRWLSPVREFVLGALSASGSSMTDLWRRPYPDILAKAAGFWSSKIRQSRVHWPHLETRRCPLTFTRSWMMRRGTKLSTVLSRARLRRRPLAFTLPQTHSPTAATKEYASPGRRSTLESIRF